MANSLMKISDIKANPNNPRIIKDDKFKKLVESVKSFPEMLELRPIVVNKDMIILGGNMRFKACKEAWIKEIPVIIADNLTEDQEREFLIKDNVSGGEWDWDILANEWDKEELEEWGLDVPEGYITPDEEKELIEDDVPEIEEEIIVQEWDIFQLGKHTLMCWDSMSEENIKTLLWNSVWKIHCISDPPYWIAYNPDKHWMIKNDDTFLDYTALAKKYSNGFFCMWTGYQVLDIWMQLVKTTFDKITNLIIWHKWGGWMGDCARTLAQDYEILIVSNRSNEIQGWRWNATWYWNREEKQEYLKRASKEAMKEILQNQIDWQAIWKVSKDDTSSYMHPTQKPVEINQRVLENFTEIGDTVLDLFGWSGSNLIACEKTQRTCRMMELDAKYVQVILKRYVQYTGNSNWVRCVNRSFDIESILSSK